MRYLSFPNFQKSDHSPPGAARARCHAQVLNRILGKGCYLSYLPKDQWHGRLLTAERARRLVPSGCEPPLCGDPTGPNNPFINRKHERRTFTAVSGIRKRFPNAKKRMKGVHSQRFPEAISECEEANERRTFTAVFGSDFRMRKSE